MKVNYKGLNLAHRAIGCIDGPTEQDGGLTRVFEVHREITGSGITSYRCSQLPWYTIFAMMVSAPSVLLRLVPKNTGMDDGRTSGRALEDSSWYLHHKDRQ